MNTNQDGAAEAAEPTTRPERGVKAWEGMRERERSEWVALRVFGGSKKKWRWYAWTTHSDPDFKGDGQRGMKVVDYNGPDFNSDAAADNLVRMVMGRKGTATVKRFYDALWIVLYGRWKGSVSHQARDFDLRRLYPMNFYEVGDYSHAAYLTLAESEGEKP